MCLKVWCNSLQHFQISQNRIFVFSPHLLVLMPKYSTYNEHPVKWRICLPQRAGFWAAYLGILFYVLISKSKAEWRISKYYLFGPFWLENNLLSILGDTENGIIDFINNIQNYELNCEEKFKISIRRERYW